MMVYSFNKLKFYQVFYKQEIELKYLKEKELIQYEYYKELLTKEEEINKIKHDIRNDLQVISLVKNKDEREKLISTIDKKIDKNTLQKYSNNNILNMLLNIKREEALKNNIDIDIAIKKKLNLEDIDIVNLFSNILDNAIKSSKNGSINLVVEKNANNIKIYCKNTITSNIKGSGYGLKIIKDIVNKYNGILEYSNNNDYFDLIILIPE